MVDKMPAPRSHNDRAKERTKKFSPNNRYFLLVLIIVLLGFTISDAVEAMEEYEVKTALILNLALLTEWPEGTFKMPDSPMNLCVIGDNIVQEAFIQVSDKKIGRRGLVISNITRSRNIDPCHVIFLGNQDRIRLAQIHAATEGKPILTIDDINHLTTFKSIVNLQKGEEKMELYINLNLADKARLKISSRVLKLAHIVS